MPIVSGNNSVASFQLNPAGKPTLASSFPADPTNSVGNVQSAIVRTLFLTSKVRLSVIGLYFSSFGLYTTA